MSVTFIIVPLLVLLFLGIAKMGIDEAIITKKVRKKLAKYNCEFISLEDTDDQFTPSELPLIPSWKKHAFMGHRPLAAAAKQFDYMEVHFCTSEKEVVRSLIAVNFSFFQYKIYFQVKLKKLQNKTT